MGVLSNNHAQIGPGALISASYVSDIYDVLMGTEREDIILSGSLSITGSIRGNLTGTASNSVSSSFAVTSSYALNSENSIFANTASYSTSASYAETASYSIIHVESITSSSFAETASYAVTASHALSTNLPYKVYTALLTQAGTDAPVATVLDNTIGDIQISYIGVGYYQITSTDTLFPYNKTFTDGFDNAAKMHAISDTNATKINGWYQLYNQDGADYLVIDVYNDTLDGKIELGDLLGSNGQLPIEIRVYN